MEVVIDIPFKYRNYVKKVLKLKKKRGSYEYILVLNPGYAVNGEYDAIYLNSKSEILEALKMVEKRRSLLSRIKQELIERYVIM